MDEYALIVRQTSLTVEHEIDQFELTIQNPHTIANSYDIAVNFSTPV